MTSSGQRDSVLASKVLPEDALAKARQARQTRLEFSPSYVGVGAYRLCTDKNLYIPAWDKCRHGFFRGAAIGFGWGLLTFNIQRKFVEIFLANSPRVTGLSHDSLYGYQLPFSVTTYATLLFLSSQITMIFKLCLSHNIRIARERAWDQTVRSRGKDPEFWQPYVEEWQHPPPLTKSTWEKWVGGWFGRFVIRRVIMIPLNFYPFVGLAVGAYFKAIGTARYLHKQYFAAKKMSPEQIAIFMEERKWEYRAFGFAAALLEGLPIIGLLFTISNRVGAAMWAHDLEKRQHAVAAGEIKPLPSHPPASNIELKPINQRSTAMAGGWEDPKTL